MAPSVIAEFSSKLTTLVFTFGGTVIVSALIALFAARKWGGKSHRDRQAIFTVVCAIGVAVAGMLSLYRLGIFR
jgi:hypothetical protein